MESTMVIKGKNIQSSSQLQPADYIITDRSVGFYDNHRGIYVGDDMVIHLLPPESFPCRKCGHRPGLHGGIVKTCLDCFRNDHSVSVYICNEYDMSPDEVVKTATNFYEKIHTVGDYYDFATFCETGRRLSSEQRSEFLQAYSDGMAILNIAKTGHYVAKTGRYVAGAIAGLATACVAFCSW